jgi:ubiquinone/menaquinone biosynthesis C-methylase UbiE
MPSEQRDAKFIHERAQYEYFYTLFFGLDGAKYNDKKILDIGCGPMGSSEWADQTSVRIGLDPLADEYCKLGTASHHMRCVAAVSEYIPFADEPFDFVTSLNSLDHVVDVRQTVNEIKRVTAAHGLF